MSMREISSAGPLEGEALVFAGGMADVVVSSSSLAVVVVVVGSGVVVDGLGCSGATGSGCSGCASVVDEGCGCSSTWSGDGLVVWSAGVGIMAWSGRWSEVQSQSQVASRRWRYRRLAESGEGGQALVSVQVQARMRRRIVLGMGLARAADAARGQPSSGPA